MSTELIIVRHGESETNMGLSREPHCALTKNGSLQAQQVGQRLAIYRTRCLLGQKYQLRWKPSSPEQGAEP